MSSSAICRRSLSHAVTDEKVLRRVMSKTSSAPEAPRKYDRVIDLYVSCPAVSHSDSFICFCSGSFATLPLAPLVVGEVGGATVSLAEVGLLILYCRLAGGPTGTIREPNSTPMVTSWCETKRPSHRRIVSYWHQQHAESWDQA
jgi:hypothetical protein